MPEFISRLEHFDVVGSTNDVVRDWLAAGVPEVCLASADEQTAGRGREGRSWVAPSGTAVLASLGFRPTWLAPDQVWQIAATVSLAMADACEEMCGLPDGTIGLKWPNDLVVDRGDSVGIRKLAGVLGETDGLGTDDPRVVVGIGVNADWATGGFPPELARTMTSLREMTDREIDKQGLLDAFLCHLEPRIAGGLRRGAFDAYDWTDRQVTTDRDIELISPSGDTTVVHAVGVDHRSGALLVADPNIPSGQRAVVVGEIHHVRLSSLSRAGAGV